MNGFIDANLIRIQDKKQKSELKKLGPQASARLIQDIWRKNKIKRAVNKNAYFAYLSLYDSENTEEQSLSAIMFGRNVAEYGVSSKYRTTSPYAYSSAVYHRTDNFFGGVFNKLIHDYELHSLKLDGYHTIIPLFKFKNIPASEWKQYFKKDKNIRFIDQPQYKISFIAFPHYFQQNINRRIILDAIGLVASPWEIAMNIPNKDKILMVNQQIKLDDNLPNTLDELIKSTIYHRLSFIAHSSQHPTQMLALCMQKLLNKLPNTISSTAIQRIACMMDISTLFYEYHYPKFAFLIYTTLHEISLFLSKNQNIKVTRQGFHEFYLESQSTLNKALSINCNAMDKLKFIACPTTSGMNAYYLAMKLAKEMKTCSGAQPSIQVIKPCYFEFDYITQSNNRMDADIFVLSAGPILDLKGLVPGVDINKFVKHHVIDAKRTKPTTLVIDATSALYKNLQLDKTVQTLLLEGKLSIIINESHQKFGMLHADQASYGRMFGVCSRDQYCIATIDRMQENAQQDYATHLDLQIGAYISTTCSDILERIKEQHFKNGALLRQCFVQVVGVSTKIITHRHMLANFDELYFVTLSDHELKAMHYLKTNYHHIFEPRDSFGHYITSSSKTGSHLRLSPDASDGIDCLVQAAQLVFSGYCNEQDMLTILRSYVKKNCLLSNSEQIIVTALVNTILATYSTLDLRSNLPLFFILKDVLPKCHFLKRRQYFIYMEKAYFEMYFHILDIYEIKNPSTFFRVLGYLNNLNITLGIEHLYLLATSPWLNQFILNYHEALSDNHFIILLNWMKAQDLSQAQLLIENRCFADFVEKVYLNIKMILNNYPYPLRYLQEYFSTCIEALEWFYSKNSAYQGDLERLLEQFNQAIEKYCETIANNHSATFSNVLQHLFFSRAGDKNGLVRMHNKLLEEIARHALSLGRGSNLVEFTVSDTGVRTTVTAFFA